MIRGVGPVELVNLRVKKQIKIAEDQFVLTLNSPSITKVAQAGQFITIKLNKNYDPLLPRPFSIHSVDRETGDFLIYYQVLGKTSKLMAELEPGDEITVLGPLGRGFNLELENSRALLIGGGLGQAPLRFLAEELQKKNNQIYMAIGARDQEGLKNILCFEESCQEINLATQDGSLGKEGLVTELLPQIIRDFNPKIIYTCGPLPMMAKVKELAAQEKIPCQVSLETTMACGIGVCLGCTCESTNSEIYPKVCTHGPVFWAQEVKLDG